MSCSCNNSGGSKLDPTRLQSAAAWSCDIHRSQLSARVPIQVVSGLFPQQGIRVRSLAELASTQLALWDVHTVCPPEGRGWIELSSPQAFVVWAITTSQNGVERTEYRRTGPSTRDGVYIERGGVVRCYVVATMPLLVGGQIEANQQSGLRSLVPYDFATPPTADVRFWPGSWPYELRRNETYTILLDGVERPNTGAFTCGYATGYNRWFSGSFGRSITWQVVSTEVSGFGPQAFLLNLTGEQVSAPLSPWAYVQYVVGGGPVQGGQVTYSTYPAGNSNF